MSKILIDTDDLAQAAKFMKNETNALVDAHLEVVRITGEIEALVSSGQLPLKPEQSSMIGEFVAQLAKLAPGLDQMSGGLGNFANKVMQLDMTAMRMPTDGKSAAALGSGALGVLGGWGPFNRPEVQKAIAIANGAPIAEGKGEASGFIGWQTSGEGRFEAGGLVLAGGYLVQVGLGYKVEGEYRLDKDGFKAKGHAESFVGVYAEAWGSAEYGPLSAQGRTSSLTGSKATADGTAAVGWGDDGPQAELGVGGSAFMGEEWNADASANFGGYAEASAGVGFKAGLGVELDLGASFGVDEIGVRLDVGASLGIGLEIEIDLSINPSEIIGDAFDFGLGALTDPFGTMEGLGSDLFDFGEGAFDTFGDIGSAFGDLGSDIGSGLEDIGSSLVGGAEDLISDFGDLF